VRALRRLYLLVWGSDVVPALRPLLAVSLAGSLAGSAGWSFLGIWAVKRLGASSLALGLAFLAGAVLSAGAGYFGGHLSDYLGRRPLILFGWGGQALFGLLFLTVGTQTLYGLALFATIPAFAALGSAAGQALVSDLVPTGRREASYAATRVASNLGTTLGPPIGGLLLLVGSWTALFLGVFALSVAAFAVALRWLPRRGDFAPESAPERGSFGVIRRDRVFLLFLLSGVLAYLVYVAFAVVLPISLVSSHGFSPSTWGFLVVVNPLLVTLFQLRLTRRVTWISPAAKLFVSMLLMGLPFLERLAPRRGRDPRRVRGRRDALGADLADRGRGDRARRPPRLVHGRVRRDGGGRLRARAAPRPPGAPCVRRRGDVGVLRGDLGRGGLHRRGRRAARGND